MEFSDEDKEIGRKLFLGDCQFIKSCVSLDTLPSQNNSEVAFFGRSNVGKSSLINSLTNKKKLAKFSKTPGRTRQLNFFKIENKLHSLNFVDLPGYGFAKVSKTEQREWRNLIFDYISSRQNLRTILLLIDARRELTKEDNKMIDFFESQGLGWTCVITNADKIKKSEVSSKMINLKNALKNKITLYPHLFCTSSEKKTGLEELRAYIAMFAKN